MFRGAAVHWAVMFARVDHAECEGVYNDLVNSHIAAGYNPSPAYTTVRCNHGVLMGGRGWSRPSGANGTTLSNLTLFAHCAMIAPGDVPSPDLLNGLRDDIDESFRLSPDGNELHYHGQIVATACAGPDLNHWVVMGAPRPNQQQGDDDVPRRLTVTIPGVADEGSVWIAHPQRYERVWEVAPGVPVQPIGPDEFMAIRADQDALRSLVASGGGTTVINGAGASPAEVEEIATRVVLAALNKTKLSAGT